MWIWIKNIGSGIKSIFATISRVMKLDNRVTTLEERIKTIQVPTKNIRDGLTYNKTLNVYEDKATGESFCPTCLGNNKRVAVQIQGSDGKEWKCYDCKTAGFE